jgi:deoxycytidine triphosphate deaminase
MILATSAIIQALYDGAIVCDPPPARIEGAHIDVTLGAHRWMQKDDGSFEKLLPPGLAGVQFFQRGVLYLCHTQEFIGTAPGSGLLPVMFGRSTLARLGVIIHLSAGWGDEGFSSRWTMEIVTTADIEIPVGARVACIAFHRVEGAATPYAPGTRYNATRDAWKPEDMLPRKGNW